MAAPDPGRADVEVAMMKTYRMLVRETDCEQPLELIAEMRTDGRAVDFARQRLIDYPRIAAIEVWSDLTRLCRLQRRHPDAAVASVGV
jgi:hypothetical protein